MNWMGLLVLLTAVISLASGVLAWRGVYTTWYTIFPRKSYTWTLPLSTGWLLFGVATFTMHTAVDFVTGPIVYVGIACAVCGILLWAIDPRWAIPPKLR